MSNCLCTIFLNIRWLDFELNFAPAGIASTQFNGCEFKILSQQSTRLNIENQFYHQKEEPEWGRKCVDPVERIFRIFSFERIHHLNRISEIIIIDGSAKLVFIFLSDIELLINTWGISSWLLRQNFDEPWNIHSEKPCAVI